MADAVLEVVGLTKRYDSVLALDSVDLTIRAGEIFALLGPNGAGKTTLIGAVCGLVRKTAGTIRLFGIDVDQDPVTPRYQVGLVPQEINFDPFFTVSESLHIQLGYYGHPQNPSRVAEVLAALKLTDKKDSRTRALSGGMKRRLLIAKALVHSPKLVFLDEPTAGVDVDLRQELWAYVRTLTAQGTTIVLTTHYLEEAEELADRVGFIDQGRLVLLDEKTALMRRLGESRLEVRFARPVTLPNPVRALEVTLSQDGTALTYAARQGRPNTTEVLQMLFDARLPIVELDTRRPRLEDVLRLVLRSGAK